MLTKQQHNILDIHTLYTKLADATGKREHILTAHNQCIYFLTESLDNNKRIAHNNNISDKA